MGTGGAAALLLAARRQRTAETALKEKDRDQLDVARTYALQERIATPTSRAAVVRTYPNDGERTRMKNETNGGHELADDTDPAELPACPTAEKPAAAYAAPVQIRSADTGTYGAAALHGEVTRVPDAAPGTYNEVLSSAAYRIGRKVGAGIVDHTTARGELIAAGEGLIGSAHWPPNALEVARVAEAGLKAGFANP